LHGGLIGAEKDLIDTLARAQRRGLIAKGTIRGAS